MESATIAEPIVRRRPSSKKHSLLHRRTLDSASAAADGGDKSPRGHKVRHVKSLDDRIGSGDDCESALNSSKKSLAFRCPNGDSSATAAVEDDKPAQRRKIRHAKTKDSLCQSEGAVHSGPSSQRNTRAWNDPENGAPSHRHRSPNNRATATHDDKEQHIPTESVSAAEPIVPRRRPSGGRQRWVALQSQVLRHRRTLDDSSEAANGDGQPPRSFKLRHVKSLDVPCESEDEDESGTSFQKMPSRHRSPDSRPHAPHGDTAQSALTETTDATEHIYPRRPSSKRDQHSSDSHPLHRRTCDFSTTLAQEDGKPPCNRKLKHTKTIDLPCEPEDAGESGPSSQRTRAWSASGNRQSFRHRSPNNRTTDKPDDTEPGITTEATDATDRIVPRRRSSDGRQRTNALHSRVLKQVKSLETHVESDDDGTPADGQAHAPDDKEHSTLTESTEAPERIVTRRRSIDVGKQRWKGLHSRVLRHVKSLETHVESDDDGKPANGQAHAPEKEHSTLTESAEAPERIVTRRRSLDGKQRWKGLHSRVLRHVKSLETHVESDDDGKPDPYVQTGAHLRLKENPALPGSSDLSLAGNDEYDGCSSPHSVTVMTNIVRFASSLKQIHLFKDFSSAFLYELAKQLSWSVYEAGHIFFEQGDLGQAMFLLGHGEVELFTGGDSKMTFTSGAIFGEMAALSRYPIKRSSKAVAKTTCECSSIERHVFINLRGLKDCRHYKMKKDSMEAQVIKQFRHSQDCAPRPKAPEAPRNSCYNRSKLILGKNSNIIQEARAQSKESTASGSTPDTISSRINMSDSIGSHWEIADAVRVDDFTPDAWSNYLASNADRFSKASNGDCSTSSSPEVSD